MPVTGPAPIIPGVPFIDPALPTVEKGMDILKASDALAGEKGTSHFCFTDELTHAAPLVQRLFGLVTVEKTNLLGV